MTNTAQRECVALMIDLENAMDHDRLFEVKDGQDLGHENIFHWLKNLRRFFVQSGFYIHPEWSRFYLEKRPINENSHPGWHERRETAAQASQFTLIWTNPRQPAEQQLGNHLRLLKKQVLYDDVDQDLPNTILLGSADSDLIPDVEKVKYIGDTWHEDRFKIFLLQRPGRRSKLLEIVCSKQNVIQLGEIVSETK